MLLRQEMLARAFAIGLEHYEFLGQDEPWKLEWADTTRELALFQAFAPSQASGVAAVPLIGSQETTRPSRARTRSGDADAIETSWSGRWMTAA